MSYVFVCKEGWCVWLGHEGRCLHEGGEAVWNSLKGGGIEKNVGERNKDFQIGGGGTQAASLGGCLKNGGWKPLTNYGHKATRCKLVFYCQYCHEDESNKKYCKIFYENLTLSGKGELDLR